MVSNVPKCLKMSKVSTHLISGQGWELVEPGAPPGHGRIPGLLRIGACDPQRSRASILSVSGILATRTASGGVWRRAFHGAPHQRCLLAPFFFGNHSLYGLASPSLAKSRPETPAGVMGFARALLTSPLRGKYFTTAPPLVFCTPADMRI